VERWPPIYDADELKETISSLHGKPELEHWFYQLDQSGDPCQGDILALDAAVPHLDADGAPAVGDEVFSHWMVIGNTCDIARSIEDAGWVQLVPVVDMGTEDDYEAHLDVFRRYEYSRRFYLPSWSDSVKGRVMIGEFCFTVPARKELVKSSRVVARLSQRGWYLLHACLVRFLCRDDGRFDTD